MSMKCWTTAVLSSKVEGVRGGGIDKILVVLIPDFLLFDIQVNKVIILQFVANSKNVFSKEDKQTVERLSTVKGEMVRWEMA